MRVKRVFGIGMCRLWQLAVRLSVVSARSARATRSAAVVAMRTVGTARPTRATRATRTTGTTRAEMVARSTWPRGGHGAG